VIVMRNTVGIWVRKAYIQGVDFTFHSICVVSRKCVVDVHARESYATFLVEIVTFAIALSSISSITFAAITISTASTSITLQSTCVVTSFEYLGKLRGSIHVSRAGSAYVAEKFISLGICVNIGRFVVLDSSHVGLENHFPFYFVRNCVVCGRVDAVVRKPIALNADEYISSILTACNTQLASPSAWSLLSVALTIRCSRTSNTRACTRHSCTSVSRKCHWSCHAIARVVKILCKSFAVFQSISWYFGVHKRDKHYR